MRLSPIPLCNFPRNLSIRSASPLLPPLLRAHRKISPSVRAFGYPPPPGRFLVGTSDRPLTVESTPLVGAPLVGSEPIPSVIRLTHLFGFCRHPSVGSTVPYSLLIFSWVCRMGYPSPDWRLSDKFRRRIFRTALIDSHAWSVQLVRFDSRRTNNLTDLPEFPSRWGGDGSRLSSVPSASAEVL